MKQTEKHSTHQIRIRLAQTRFIISAKLTPQRALNSQRRNLPFNTEIELEQTITPTPPSPQPKIDLITEVNLTWAT